MIEEIDIYIKDRFAPEMCASISRLFDILGTLTEDDFQIQYMNIVMSDESAEMSSSEERFLDLVFDNVRFILKHHSITPADDVPIYDLLEVIEGVLALTDYEDKAAIVNQIEGANDPIEAFAACLGMVTTLDESKIYTVVDDVDPMFIKTLRTLCEGDSIDDGFVEVAAQNNIITVLKKLRAYLNYPEAKGFQLINAGLPIGAEFSSYFPHYVDVFKGKDFETIAKELVVLLYLAGDSHKSPLTFFKQITSTLFEDLSVMTKMDIAVTNICAGFEATFSPRNQKETGDAQA